METNVNRETHEVEFDLWPELEEEVILTEPRKKARKVYRTPIEKHLYAKILGGVAAMVGLFTMPFVTLPGMIIPVVIAEVYLLDRTYSKYNLLKESKSSTLSRFAAKSPENEIDRTVARTGPKEQFLK